MQILLSKLRDLGLSQDQGKIYFTLLENGDMRIQELATYTHIPRTSVYEQLKGLSQMGLVEKIIEDKFTRIKAYPIANLQHSFEEQILETKQKIESLRQIDKRIHAVIKNTTTQKTSVRYYQGKAGARQLFWNTLQTKSTVLVYSAYGRSQYVGKKFYSEFVRQSQERNIQEKVIINPHKRAINFIKRDTDTLLARTKLSDIRYISSNMLPIKGETFLYDHVYAQVTLDEEEIVGFEVESENFSKPQRAIFELIWKMAKPIRSLL